MGDRKRRGGDVQNSTQRKGELRQQLQDGRYRPEAEEIAEALIEKLDDDAVDGDALDGEEEGEADPPRLRLIRGSG